MTHDERVYHHLYVESKSPLENAERIAALEELVEDLQAENAKLREERNHWHVEQVHAYSNWEDAHKRAAELETENATLRQQLADVNESMGRVEERCAKLRYLVEDMLSCIEIRAAFGRPPTTEMYEEFAQQARELGVEVDE